MKLSSVDIPIALRDAYQAAGIEELYPPQDECINAGLLDRKNILAAIPTASGKTIIAEMAMHKEIERGGKCLYIVPLKALASEKYDDFASKKSVKVGIATGDPDQRDEYLGRYDIIVATSEKTDSLLRNKAGWLKSVTLLVVDEIHLIGDETRGATLEMVIAKMRMQNPGMQIIGLSATMGNPQSLAEWLDAALITSEWRPVDLKEGVYNSGAIHFHGNERVVPAVRKDDDLNLMLDTIEEGGQCLVFVSSRRSAEAYAKRAAASLKKKSPALDAYADIIEKADATNSGKVLANSVRNGAAFHHAGLPRAARAAVEEGFRKGEIAVISSTPTLAAGLNLPARRVIIRDYTRYEAGIGASKIPVMEYRQMAGRAGRPRLDPYGEAVLIAKEKEDVDILFEEFIDAPAEDINSQCKNQKELQTHLLALITSGFAHTFDEVEAFMEKSFYASQKKVHRSLDRNVANAIAYLKKAGMIEILENDLTPTMFGALSSRLYLQPKSATMIKEALEERDTFSDFGMLHLLCMTPDMFRFYLKASDERFVDQVLRERSEELFTEDLCEEFFASVKTALVVEYWIDEVAEDTIADTFGVGTGDIHAVVENLKWLMHAGCRIAEEFAPGFAEDVKKLEIRLVNGIKEELIPLVSLKGIGRVRARRLFNRGYTTPEKLLEGDKAEIVSILGTALTEKIFAEGTKTSHMKKASSSLPPEDEKDAEERTEKEESSTEKKPQATLFDFGE
ncbi:MAG TPA: ATP-dependent DNA helicase [Methanocorpusculum sp.]|nr:ATP-dependent DNA helicase [Methanocorpusculum sp.]